MLDIIDFLERLGQDADLGRASAEEIQDALLAADLPAAAQDVLLSGDRLRLEALVGAPPIVCCAVWVPKKEEDEEEEQETEEEAPKEVKSRRRVA